MKTIIRFLAVAVLVAASWAGLANCLSGSPANAAVSLQTVQSCTPDQLLGCVNSTITGINNAAPTCTAAGCAIPSSGPNAGAAPTLSLTCVTAGGASSSLSSTANGFRGRVTCTSTANTTATLTWATAKASQPTCVVVGETTPVLTIGTNSMTALSWTYASTVSPIFDYVCYGQ